MRGLVAAAIGLLLPALAVAAPLPAPPPSLNSGAAQRRSREELKRLEENQPRGQIKGPVIVGPQGAHPKVAPGGPRFTLQRIEFSPSHFLSRKMLAALAEPYLHHPITLADLYKLTAAVNARYAKRGLITARAIVPPQHIANGVAKVRLVEGRVGSVELPGLKYTRKSYILARLPLKNGQVLDTAALQRGLIYFDRTNDLALSAKLRPGSRFGLSDVLLQTLEPPRYRLSLLMNNEGDRSTGRLQGGVYGQVYGPLGLGDRLTVYALKSSGAFNANLGYQIPLTRRGLKLSLSVAHNQIHIINGPYEQLDIRGHANVGQLGLVQPLVANRHWLLNAAASLSYTAARTNISGVALSDSNIWTVGFGVTGSYDGRGQQWSFAQTAERGFAREVLGVHQHYWLLPGSFSGRVHLDGPLFAAFTGGWQYSTARTLPPSQLFQLGGAGTIPGYPVGTASGAKGFFGHVSVNTRLPYGLVFGAGYSYGTVFAAYPRHTELDSIDVHLQGRLPRFHAVEPLSWRVLVATPRRTVLPDQSHWTAYFNIVAPIDL